MVLLLCQYALEVNIANYQHLSSAAHTFAQPSPLCAPAAPEVLQRKRGYAAKQADVWSSGVMLYAMLCCSYPFERPEDEQDPRGHHAVVRRILTGALSNAAYRLRYKRTQIFRHPHWCALQCSPSLALQDNAI